MTTAQHNIIRYHTTFPESEHDLFDVARIIACRYIIGDLNEHDIEAMHTDDGLVYDHTACWFESGNETLGVWVFRNYDESSYGEEYFRFSNFDGLTVYRYADGEQLRPASRIEAARSILAEITDNEHGAIDIDGTTCYVI
jgi:hypothetical protein